jgi:putative ABC transport system ATP-binding protein
MMAVIAGLEAASSGRVTVAGRELTGMSEDELALLRRQEIGIVFQSFHLVPTMTALENVAIPLELSGREDALEAAADSLARVGLSERLDHYPAQLSGGEQQRVALARAVVHGPSILLADEPTGNLDGATGKVIIDLMFELHRATGTTLVLITHDEELAAACDRVVRIEDGRIVADSPAAAPSRTSGLGS